MEKLGVRFEQKRGHYMVLEGDPSWKQLDCDEFQLRMLRACEVPGLLKLEASVLDGDVAFRYRLDGNRMLSALVRAEKWTMAEWMAVLCRLAEILEESRLYMLDEDRFCLEEDLIFVGEGRNDLQLAYLPLLKEQPRLAERLHLLVTRWLSFVKDPDGRLLQRLFQLLSAPDFKPAALRSFARQYLLEQSLYGGAYRVSSAGETAGARFPCNAGGAQSASNAGDHPAGIPSSEKSDVPMSASSGWRWFQPSRSDAHSLSSLLDEESAPLSEPYSKWPDEPEENPNGKNKIWLICAAAGLTAIGWRWGYAEDPGTRGLILSIGITMLSAAGSLLIWRRYLRDNRHSPEEGDHAAPPLLAKQQPEIERPANLLDEEPALPQFSMVNHEMENRTQMLEDRTQLLTEEKREASPRAASSLLWETAPGTPIIPLTSDSFLIGRSREACAHVDETSGVSRVHLELLRTEDGWTAKDLGSRNGSKLNGVPMVAYATYPLKAEDCLELAGSRYRLK